MAVRPNQMATVSAPLGQRRTPVQLEQEQRALMQRMRPDFSPSTHWLQAAARGLDPVIAALQMNDVDKDVRANADYNAQITKSLLSPGAEVPASGGDPAANGQQSIAAILADPYASPGVRSLAGKMWERANPKPQQPTEFERALTASGVQPGTPEWIEANKAKVLNVTDPFVTVPLPQGPYLGRQSGLAQYLPGTGGQAPATSGDMSAPPSGEVTPFADFGAAGQLIQSMGASGFLSWQQKHGTPVRVNGPEELAKLPAGTKVMAPDGRIAVKQ